MRHSAFHFRVCLQTLDWFSVLQGVNSCMSARCCWRCCRRHGRTGHCRSRFERDVDTTDQTCVREHSLADVGSTASLAELKASALVNALQSVKSSNLSTLKAPHMQCAHVRMQHDCMLHHHQHVCSVTHDSCCHALCSFALFGAW